ncbi:MAG: PAS domain S-box protein, partial [Alphaproteobacteria bacterium]
LRFINRTGAQWYGSCPEALTGRYMRDLALPEAYDAMQDLFDQALKGEAVVSEQILKYPDGRKRNVRVNYIPHFYARGRVKGFFALVEDITEQTRVEKQLAQSQRIGALGQLTGGVAHEFNNLLGIIIGNLELLEGALDGVSEPDADKFVATAMRAALRGVEQTQRLLSFARKQELRPTAVNLTAAMPDIATMIRTALAPNMMLTIDLADDLWPILVDPGQLEGALLNLAINARDAMPDGGTLTIRAANRHISTPTDVPVMQGTMPPGDYVVLSITDTGVGMSDEVLEYVFDPFFTTKPVGQGSGLGLSMVYGFVRQMGGHVDIDTAPGHGTTVHLFFRRAAIPRMCMACPVPAMDSAAPSSYRNAEPTPLPTPARRTGPLSQSG